MCGPGDENDAPDLSVQQRLFDDLLDKYSDGLEPLENWTTRDLVELSRVVDMELQARQPHYTLGFEDDGEAA